VIGCLLTLAALGAGFYAGMFGLVIAGLVGLGVGLAYFMSEVFAAFSVNAPIAHLRMVPPDGGGRDPAYRSYFTGPVLRDHRLAVRNSLQQTWARVVSSESGSGTPSLVDKVRSSLSRFDGDYTALVAVPAGFGVCAGLVGGVLAAGVFIGLASLVFFVLLCGLVLVALLTTVLSRGFEATAVAVRGLRVQCPVCHDQVMRPIFRCPNCDVQHRNLLPGMAGVLRRTCRCGSPIPTLLVNGKAGLVSQCPSDACDQAQLPRNAQVDPTFHVPVVAGTSAGKSVYMFSAVARLVARGGETGEFDFAADQARDEFTAILRSGALKDPKLFRRTSAAMPKAFTLNMRMRGSSRKLLYLYDSAGEWLDNVDKLAGSAFLAHAKGMVFIVDPFSIDPVARAASLGTRREARPSPVDAKTILDKMVQSLQEHVRDNRAHRLPVRVAVVISKADALLADPALRHPYDGLAAGDRAGRSAAARDWLAGQVDRSDLVVSLDNHFSAVSYFVVSYQDHGEVTPHAGPGAAHPVTNDDPAEPLLWLISGKGRNR
jgi:hypothetical protein